MQNGEIHNIKKNLKIAETNAMELQGFKNQYDLKVEKADKEIFKDKKKLAPKLEELKTIAKEKSLNDQ